ncbi:MAG: hypothetical protein M0P71_09040 [Melioribacteraceae bacterium]|nr:hypothetical protein [Melioribacteraceae bacterium]
MNRIKYVFSISALLLFLMIFNTGCELIDPTEVNNPSITQEKLFKDATGGAKPLLSGLEFAFSDAVNRASFFTEVVSDNYLNTSTYISTQLDDPRLITPNDQYLGDFREIYGKLQTLHSLADFGLNTVLKADQQSTNKDAARVHFYKGMAILLLCENFQAFPLEENGNMIKAEVAIKTAIEQFNKSYQLDGSGTNGINNKLALARAYRQDGNKASSIQAANEALGLSGNYVYNAEYDPINLANRMNLFTVVRNQNDMQPLPRLDFLDPKFANRDGSDPIPVLKSEEAYLILAEAALSNGDLEGTKTQLRNLIQLVKTRNVVPYLDRDPRRNRPNNNNDKVKADPSSPAIGGLIFKRSGSTINTYPISATSVTLEQIDGLSDNNEAFRVLYLMRQEILFSEGRRMSDLGIRLPVMNRQIDANPNVNPGDYGTSVFVPAYIPQGRDLDSFDYDTATNLVTIKYDMNKILMQNKSIVSPFF